MVVVADASPINYLALIGELELLKSLYGRIVIPRAVMNELTHPSAPPLVATFASAPPSWIEAVEIEVRDPMPDLDPGETAAIALAELHPQFPSADR